MIIFKRREEIMYSFNEIINRKNTNCVKYDALDTYFGKTDLQPLWVADMDFKTPDVINNAIIKRAQHGIYGYAKTTDKAYSLVIQWMKNRHNWTIQKEWITFVNGVVPAYSAAIEALSDKGDEIIVQTPVYFPLFNCVKNNNRKLVTNPLIEKDGYYTMDLEDLRSKITPKTKILTLCSPHNPVGRVWNKEELTELAQICIQNNITIISDEIHADIVFKKFTPLASISNEIANITLTLNSPGKTFNIAGLNCAYVISKNKQILDKYKETAIKREITSINVFGFTALEAAYEYGEEWLEELLAYIKSNINFVDYYLKNNNSKIIFLPPEATYLLWFSFNNFIMSHSKVNQKLLNESKVALNSGIAFGPEGKGFFRLNCALPKENLELALSRLVIIFR
jgi:cystathionine beta-lyase